MAQKNLTTIVITVLSGVIMLLVATLLNTSAAVQKLDARIHSIESKKLLSRDEYSQFIDFLKIRFNILDQKIDKISDRMDNRYAERE